MISCRQNISEIGRKSHGNSGTIGTRSSVARRRQGSREHVPITCNAGSRRSASLPRVTADRARARPTATVFRWHQKIDRDTLECMATPATAPFAEPKYVRTLSGWLDPMGQEGMVTTPHYLASQAGFSVLKNGGNAIDAAIAA